MSLSCRRLTAAAVESPAATHHISRGFSSSIGIMQINRRRGFGGGSRAILRSSPWVIETVWPKGELEQGKRERPPRCCSFDRQHPHHDAEAAAAAAAKGRDEGIGRSGEVIVTAVATVVLGVGNRVLYKLALIPLKHYPFFLAQLATFGYIFVYFSILYLRYQAGKVTDEMLSLPKSPLIAVGLLEALAAASGMAAGAILSGASIPILSQSFLVWQLVLSYVFLGRRYSFKQLFGCFLVTIGVIVTVASGSGTGSLMEAGIFWSILMLVSFLLQAADSVLKETIFLDAAQRLKGGTVDLFVINSYGSAFQAVFICLLLPFLSNLWGIPFNQLPNYLKDGAACFLNVGTMSNRCNGAPLLPLLFIIVNMGFNISLLHLLKISSAVVSCLASTFSASLSTESSSKERRELLVQHLLVKEDDQKLVLELEKRIANGEDLSDLAVEYSICPSKEEGGMLGWVRRGQMVPEFEEAAFAAPLNKVARCKTKFGWHLLQVLSDREESILEDIQPVEFHEKLQNPAFLKEAQLIDVREPEEVAQASLPGFKVLPLRQFGSWGPEISTKFNPQIDTYVLCHHGMRSLQVAKWLQTQGFRRVYNVAGGIHQYAVKADPSVPTY